MKAIGEAIACLFFMLSFIMSLILILLFSGNMEFGILQEETTSKINTITGEFEISKTYYTTKLIPNEETFRPIFSLMFQMLFFFSIIMFIVKSFLIPHLQKTKAQKNKQ
jgi:quinol-cytochrome oxidoreductase complex cytochrome b subunit